MMSYEEIYFMLNSAELGFAVEGDDVNNAIGIGDLVRKSTTDGKVAVYKNGDTITMVGDAYGLWAVRYKVGEY